MVHSFRPDILKNTYCLHGCFWHDHKKLLQQWWYVTLQKTVESNQHMLILSTFVSSSFLIINLTELALLSFQLYCFLIWLFHQRRLFPLVFSMIKNTLKVFDNFEKKPKHQSAWSNVFWYAKIHIFWKYTQYSIHWDKTKISFRQNKLYKKCPLFSFVSSNSSHFYF